MTDFSKAQFLFQDKLTHVSIQAFRRKRQSALVDGSGKVVRLMTWEEWRDFKKEWPREIEADGLKLTQIWTLIPTTESTA
jgi:hypothetical protein